MSCDYFKPSKNQAYKEAAEESKDNENTVTKKVKCTNLFCFAQAIASATDGKVGQEYSEGKCAINFLLPE
ncbi:MAG: hypothetical protein UT00_C0033G0002 [Parcubacteria group bacterium GW2011_GWA1_38_7]|nr:MAG: hypothetical protein UT00_C0033G0002 [Parcubacteria group bacterium GW2011_GWA1_38_7]